MNHISPRHLEIECARLRTTNERLRQKLQLRDGRHTKRVHRAYVSALALATLHVAYLPTTRSMAQSAGLSQRQWETGLALLRLARVINGNRWQVHILATIDDRLQAAVDRSLADPEVFRARLPRHATR